MTSSLKNLAIELVNELKSHTDAKSRLYYLEQLKELLLNRDKQIIDKRFICFEM